jgi:hypothetical protein
MAGLRSVKPHGRRASVALWLGGFVVVASTIAWLWVSFVQREATLYEADHVAYWAITVALADDVTHNALDAAVTVARSVDQRELNLVPSVPLLPAMLLFGKGREVYIAAVAVLYALPSLLLGWWVLRRWCPKTVDTPASSVWAWIVTCGLFTPLWEPVALGYLDIGGLVLAFAALGTLLTDARDPGSEPGAGRRALVAGAVVGLLALFRRWYGIWSAALLAVLTVEAIVLLIRGRGSGAAWKQRLLTVAAGVVTTVVLAPGRVWTILTTDYGDRFVHYDAGAGWIRDLFSYVERFGVITMAVFVVGAVVAVVAPAARRGAAILIAHLVVVHGVFRSIQDPSPQHWYLVLPGLMLLTARGLVFLDGNASAVRRQALRAGGVVLALMVAAQTTGIIDRLQRPLGPSVRIAPAQREDLDVVRALLATLDARLRGGSEWITVLAGSGPLTDTALGFANLSLGTDHLSPHRVLVGSQVDLRDGFPDALLVADLVVVPDPGQYRRPPVTQRVVSEPTECFAHGEGIAMAFTPLGEAFQLGEGVAFRIFERHRPNRPAEVADLSERLRRWYPDRPSVWRSTGVRAPAVGR